jgi:hypothetical protein
MPNKDCPWGYTRGLHQQVPVCRKALFYGAFSKPFYYGGEGGTLGPIFAHPPISSKNNARRRVTDYTDDYTVDYCSGQRRRIARSPAAVNVLRAGQLGNLIQG